MTLRRKIVAKLSKPPALSGSLGMVVIRGHTDRKISVDPDFYEAQRFSGSSMSVSDESVWKARVASALRKTPTVALPSLTLFRARVIDETILGWEQMGPPLASVAKEGRYNPAGAPVLYLCTSADGARLEVLGRPLCIQEYCLDLSHLRIADIASAQTANLLHSAFDVAEQACVPDRPGPSDFSFPHFLASQTEHFGFDGFLVPGVRGGSDIYYQNVILFNPESKWRSWSRGPSGFLLET